MGSKYFKAKAVYEPGKPFMGGGEAVEAADQAWHDRHVFTNADEALWETTPARSDSPLRVLETKELGQRIQKALDGLPAEYRLLLLLVADEQLSYQQVGALTEQSADAVRGKLHRARKAFAVLFEKTA